MVDGTWVKLEFLNPSGSIKARIARYMIERAEREGLLRRHGNRRSPPFKVQRTGRSQLPG
jgi:threonine synthase